MMEAPPAYEEQTPLVSEIEEDEGGYIPGPPPDYITTLNMEEYGPPQYDDPPIEGATDTEQMVAGGEGTPVEALDMPRLAYVDFLPYCFRAGDKATQARPIFDTFRGLFKHANAWLNNNRLYKVLDIVSIERRVGFDGIVDSGEAIEHTAAQGHNGILRGVRLWLTAQPDPSAPAQQISYFNWLPREDPLKQDVILGAGIFLKTTINFPDFRPMSETIHQLNECIKQRPIPGSILTAQTLQLLYQQAWGKKCLDPDISCYFSKANTPKLYLDYLRVFFVSGEPSTQTIGIQDFVPLITHNPRGMAALPRLEEYDQVYQKATTWLNQNNSKTLKVLNIQSILTKALARSTHRFVGCEVGDSIVNSDETWYRELGYNFTHLVKVIRIAFINIDMLENKVATPVTSRLFLPVRVGAKAAETLPQTLYRINAWLNITGAPVCCVGTEKFLLNPELAHNAIKPEEMTMTLGNRGIYTMTGLRLYLNGDFTEPDPALLPPVVDSESLGAPPAASSSCTIL